MVYKASPCQLTFTTILSIYKDMQKKDEEYRYFSYGIYTGYRKDFEGIVDKAFLLKMKQMYGESI
jgi:hypothetical protein